ncbi:MAG: hypothetical protein Q4A62_00960 [Eikenella sp.]|nr:hypothetical protein [Eikenella sp.]
MMNPMSAVRAAAMALLLFGLTACGTPRALKPFIGRPVGALAAQWGQPDSYSDRSNSRVYHWRRCRPLQSYNHYRGYRYEGSSTAYFCADYRVHTDRQTGLIQNINANGAVRSYSH